MKGYCFNNHATEPLQGGSHNQKKDPYPYSRNSGVRINDEKTTTFDSCCKRIDDKCLCRSGAGCPVPHRVHRAAKPGGGFDLTCKLIQVSMLETGAIAKPMRVTYMPGGVGAVAYNAIVAQRPAEAGTVVAFSGGSLLNLSQGKFGRYGVDDVRWLATVGTDYGMIAVRADSPWKSLKDLLTAMEKDPNSVVIGAGASIGSQDWMKAALLAQQAKVDPHKMRYVAFEGGGEPVTALMGNHVQAVSGDLSEMVPYLNGDKIRVLAVFSENRLPGPSWRTSLPQKNRVMTWSGRLSAVSSSGQK